MDLVGFIFFLGSLLFIGCTQPTPSPSPSFLDQPTEPSLPDQRIEEQEMIDYKMRDESIREASLTDLEINDLQVKMNLQVVKISFHLPQLHIHNPLN